MLQGRKTQASKETKQNKTDTQFIIRDTSRGTHRETVWNSFCLKIEIRQKYMPGEKGCGHPLMRRSTVKRRINHLHRAVLQGLCLPLANYLVSFPHPTCTRILLHFQTYLFTKMDSSAEAYGGLDITYYGALPPPFWPPRGLPAHVKSGTSSLAFQMVILSLYFSRAQLLPLALSLECLGRTKLQFYCTWQTPAVQPRGPSISYLNNVRGWIVIMGVSVNTDG